MPSKSGGSRPALRDIDGILLLDKPQGLSSNQALQRARYLLGAKKAGHTGSLDPLATGLLPLCFGEATKIAGELLGADKAYRTTARLGIVTDSEDAQGAVLATSPVPELAIETVRSVLDRFVGTIEQLPPAYSALKLDGVPAYRLARRGESVSLSPRPVRIARIDLLGLERDRLQLEVECGSGTYIRSLVRDIGAALGCGAHVEALRRLWVAPFVQPQMIGLEELAALEPHERETRLLSIEAGLTAQAWLRLGANDCRRLGSGQRFAVSAAPGPYVVADETGRALGLVEVDAVHQVQVRRLFRWAAIS